MQSPQSICCVASSHLSTNLPLQGNGSTLHEESEYALRKPQGRLIRRGVFDHCVFDVLHRLSTNSLFLTHSPPILSLIQSAWFSLSAQIWTLFWWLWEDFKALSHRKIKKFWWRWMVEHERIPIHIHSRAFSPWTGSRFEWASRWTIQTYAGQFSFQRQRETSYPAAHFGEICLVLSPLEPGIWHDPPLIEIVWSGKVEGVMLKLLKDRRMEHWSCISSTTSCHGYVFYMRFLQRQR